MVHLNNTCEITIVIKRTPELTVDGKRLSVKIIYYSMMIIWTINDMHFAF